eukprot:6252235-Amphidinium_carterae.1
MLETVPQVRFSFWDSEPPTPPHWAHSPFRGSSAAPFRGPIKSWTNPKLALKHQPQNPQMSQWTRFWAGTQGPAALAYTI